MLLALGFASAVGVIAGLYPVIHASKLQPIAAVCTQLQLQRVFRCGTIDA
jgi:ABC-type lipoprotein release transport system permease subunit